MFTIKRHIEGITLNGFEFVLDNENQVRKFNTVEEALNLLPYDSIEEAEEYGIFIEQKDENS